jgi:hypothetical protein
VKLAIHQPQYWPWAPYIHKVMSADKFVYLDTVQFSKNGVQNRNQIKTAQGASWLTLPVKHQLGLSIREAQITDARIMEKHWKSVLFNYGRTEGFRRWKDELHAVFGMKTDSLCDIAATSTEWMLDKMGVRTRRLRASELSDVTGRGSSLIASICEALGATVYLTGTGALAYLNAADFSSIGCQIQIQQWGRLNYEQTHPGAGFVQDLSTLDLLLNHPDTAAQMIGETGAWKEFRNAA